MSLSVANNPLLCRFLPSVVQKKILRNRIVVLNEVMRRDVFQAITDLARRTILVLIATQTVVVDALKIKIC